MNREEYLNQLKKYLKRLPQSDYESAMEYFTEYFEEAGEEGEQRVIKELGTPKEAAAELLSNLLREKASGQRKELRKSSIGNIVWIAFLAIFAAPIGIPLIASAFVLFLCTLIVIVSVIFSAWIGAVALAIIGVKFFLRGIVAIPFSIPGACMIIGTGLLSIGIGIFMAVAGWYLCRWFRNWIPRCVQRILRKGVGKK